MNTQSQYSSMHTHTIFCDGSDSVETMCQAAYEKKIFAIGFSEHAPLAKQLGKDSLWNLKEECVNQYIDDVLAAQKRWQGKLKVFLGYEVDYIKGRRSSADSDITALNLDYIIGSVHYLLYGTESFTVDGTEEEFERGLNKGFNGNAEKLMHSYYDAMLEMIETGGFDILGHADLLKKNSQGKNYWKEETEIKRQREVAHAAAKAGLVIEVNTGGINRNKIKDVYPSLSFLRIIHEYNIPVIITADAHCAADIIGNYDTAVNTLIGVGFKEHVLFNGKNNGISIWQKEKL